MTDGPDPGVSDIDPDYIDPADDIADMIENGNHDVELSDDQDPQELRECIESVENSTHSVPVERR